MADNGSRVTPEELRRSGAAALSGPSTGSSIISGSNESGYPAKCSSGSKDWNASFFSATNRTSMGTNLLIFEDACPVFAQSPSSRLSSRIAGWDGLLSPGNPEGQRRHSTSDAARGGSAAQSAFISFPIRQRLPRTGLNRLICARFNAVARRVTQYHAGPFCTMKARLARDFFANWSLDLRCLPRRRFLRTLR